VRGGDLIDDIKIIDDEFTLGPGEEKKAQFTIDVKKSGTTESNINVKFSPINEGNGVGLSSTIIIIAKGDDREGKGFFDFLKSDEPEESSESVSVGVREDEEISEVKEKSSNSIGIFAITGTITTIMFISLLILLTLSTRYRKNKLNKKRVVQGDE